MITNEQIKELQQRVETLGRCISVEEKRADVERKTERTLAADFWDDPKEAEKFLKEMSGVKFWVTGYDKVAAAVEDQTVEGFATEKNPKFEVYADKAGEFRFRLKAGNGQIIATSEGYKSKSGCMNGVESVKKNAPDAEVVEAE